MRETIKTVTNRSAYNKWNLRKQDHWSSRERNRRRREHYYACSHNKNDYYGYDLINQVEISKEEARYKITQENYGIKWEWRYRFKCTVVRKRTPSWKLTSKCKKQYQRKKLKVDSTWNWQNRYNYYHEYSW